MPTSIRPGDVLSDRYRLVDLLDESRGARFFRGFDDVLARQVAIHAIACDDERAPLLSTAARESARTHDRRILRVLDTDEQDGVCYVVNEWGSGRSLDIVLADEGPLSPRRAAWICSQVASALAACHELGAAHGRLVPENVLIDTHGHIRIIGYAVDAALYGLPAGRRSADVTDLAGILYAGLTGRWAGVSSSGLPPAHLEGDGVLRPRRVRAGIPRPLDQLCDAVLNDSTASAHALADHGFEDLSTAAGIAALLEDYVGDPTALEEAEAQRARSLGPSPFGPAAPFTPPEPPQDAATRTVPVLPPDRVPEPKVEDESPTADQEPVRPDPADIPTQAGMPVFDEDNDQVAWVARTTRKPAPPPPLDEPEPKPLFAPEPEDGRPVRTPRAGTPAAAAPPAGHPEYWPWGDSTAGSTGSGTMPPIDDSGSWMEDSGYLDEVPGRGWLRTAMFLAALLALLLVVVFAFGLGRGDSPRGPDGETSSAPSPGGSAAVQPISGLVAEDFDPQGDPPEENPELAPLAVDGKADTSWRSLTYHQDMGPAGLKTGIGMTVDLGEVRAPRQVDVTFVGGEPTQFQLFLTTEPPKNLDGLNPIASDGGVDTVSVTLDGQDRGRYLVVWLTSLPTVDGGGFRGEIAEIAVLE